MNPYLLINLKQRYKPTIANDYLSIEIIMKKLPQKLNVICALEAAKLTLPRWEALHPLMTKEQKEAHKKGIEILENWLEGKATIDELDDERKKDKMMGGVYHVILYTINSVIHVGRTAEHAAAAAVFAATYGNNKYYVEWWGKCYPLIEKEYQDKYNIFCKEINENLTYYA